MQAEKDCGTSIRNGHKRGKHYIGTENQKVSKYQISDIQGVLWARNWTNLKLELNWRKGTYDMVVKDKAETNLSEEESPV